MNTTFSLVAITLRLSVCPVTQADVVPIGYSGMAQVDATSYLVVHDKRVDEDGFRLGLLTIHKGKAPAYAPILVNDWKNDDGRASDLESICSIPGKDAEYLLAEAGYWDGKYGRIFHVRHNAGTADVLNVYHLPMLKGSTKADPEGDNFEGMVCIGNGDRFVVVVGERGGSDAYPNGVLRLGVLQYDTSSLSWDDYSNIAMDIAAPGSWDNSSSKRSISDLHMDGGGVIWAVATEDLSDEGPFRSVIYRAALVSTQNTATPVIPIRNKQASWVVDGFKVEALSGPTSVVKGSVMSFATEDESYSGQWRPLFPPTE